MHVFTKNIVSKMLCEQTFFVDLFQNRLSQVVLEE